MKNLKLFGWIAAAVLCWSSCVFGQESAAVQRPPTEKLLPESTVVYIQIRNVPEFIENMNESNIGKLMAHEKIAPLAERLWGSVKDQYEKVRDDVGVSLDQLQTLLTGEVCFAVVNFKDRSPGVVVFVDYDPEAATLDTLIDRGEELAASEEQLLEPIQEADVEISAVKTGDGPTIHHFRHGGTFVAGTDLELIKEVLARWRGETFENVRTLEENRKFITIMNRCRGSKEAPVDARAFIDPIELVRGLTRGDIGAQIVINLLPTLGLDGLLGIGGSVINNDDGYESITHMHVLMANPRAGILEMLAVRPGNCDPHPWVPDDVTNYLTGNLQVDQFYDQLRNMVDLIQGEGSLDEAVQKNVNEQLEINLQDDVLAQITGRATFVQWVETPVRFNSQCTVIALELKDPEAFTKTFEHVLDKAMELGRRRPTPQGVETQPSDQENSEADEPKIKEEYRGITLWTFKEVLGGRRNRSRVRVEVDEQGGVERFSEPEDEGDDEDFEMREQYPNFVILDNCLIFSDSRAFLEKAIDTFKGDHPPLAEDEQYRRITRHTQRLLGTSVPAGAMYSRPDLALGMWYDLAQSKQTKDLLDKNSEDNEFVGSIRSALEENPLPDFEELKQFFAPSGGFVTSDETGIHLLGFQLKIEDDR